MGVLDLSPLTLGDNPQEWPELDPELVEIIRQATKDSPLGVPPLWVKEIASAIDADRWYLIKNVNQLPDRNHSRPLPYITRGGVPMPHHGKMGIYRFYKQMTKVQDSHISVTRQMSKAEALGHHVPISVRQAAKFWDEQRKAFRLSEARAVRMLGPKPSPQLRDGRPVNGPKDLSVYLRSSGSGD